MVTCPKCSATLPDWAKNCQFCGSDVRAVVRPVETSAKKNYGYGPPKWVWAAYYAVSVYFILGGLADVMASIMATSQKDFLGEPQGYSLGVILGIVFGAVSALVGIGLLLRIELARGIVNFICGMKIICGLASAGATIAGAMLFGPWLLFIKVLDIVTAGFMIYLIGETEKSAPNL